MSISFKGYCRHCKYINMGPHEKPCNDCRFILGGSKDRWKLGISKWEFVKFVIKKSMAIIKDYIRRIKNEYPR